MNHHPTLGTISIIVAGMFALVIINIAPIVHAQSSFPVPPPPTTPIVPVPPRVQLPVPPAVAQPCVNNGTNVLGPKDSGKQILNQENQCTGTPKNVNQAPITNAGPDQTITPLLGTTVALDGTASFATTSGATIVSYSGSKRLEVQQSH